MATHTRPRRSSRDKAAGVGLADKLRAFGLRFPGAHLKSPWPGHLDLAVNDKTFAYLSTPGEPFSISCKLPQSAALALLLADTKPTPYGLGKSGWVSFTPAGKTSPDVKLLEAWIEESYRAQAPKRLQKALPPTTNVTPADPPKPKTRRAVAKPPAARVGAVRRAK